MMRSLIGCLLVAVMATTLTAQCAGNGLGQSFISATPVRIGGTYTVSWGSPGLAFATTALLAASNFGPYVDPIVGPVCLDLSAPVIAASGGLDPLGNAQFQAAVPNIPSLTGLPPAYLMAVVVDFSLPSPFLSIPKTIPVFFENGDGYTPALGSMVGGGRALHTSTALGAGPTSNETRIFIAGGGAGSILAPVATDTTEIYDVLTRAFTAGPTLSSTRALHTAVRLQNGTVLIAGGADNFGTCLATCEIYNPATNTFSPTGSMASVRAGHTMTLLGNGKVLVTGGVTSFAGGQANIVNILNSSQNTGEVYDPAVGTWSPVSNVMASKRFGAAAVLLNNGNVLVSSGMNGGTTFLGQGVPTYTSSCSIYNPTTNAFSATGAMSTGRAAHAMSVLASGDVLSSGGIVSGLLSIPTTTAQCARYNGTTWTTSGVAALPTAIALHTQNALPNGDALIVGGMTGTLLALSATANAGTHNGATYTARAQIGTNPGLGTPAGPRGSHTTTILFDGSYLVVGGTDGTNSLPSALVYTN